MYGILSIVAFTLIIILAFSFEGYLTRSCYVAQASLEVSIPLFPFPEHWDYVLVF